MKVLAIARGINYFRGGPEIIGLGAAGPNIMWVQIFRYTWAHHIASILGILIDTVEKELGLLKTN